jgi:ribonuclease R
MKKRECLEDMARKKQDPHASREAEKYENPIPSREFILSVMEEIAEPVSYESLCEALGLADDEQQSEALRRRLIAMSRDGQLISNRRGVFGLADKMELIKGRVQGNKEGSGFFIPQDGSGDLFLTPNEMLRVFDGDMVLARVAGVDRRGRKEGMIVEILERKTTQIVGRFYKDSGFGLVVPDNRRISQEVLIPENAQGKAEDGQFVVARLTNYPDRRRKATGEVIEILGDHMAPGMEIDVAVRSHGIPHEWPEAVKGALGSLPTEVAREELKGRFDLRKLPFVTIDGEDAKDFDDAVYCEPGPHGTAKLYVAIADVSHYVKPGEALDLEAQNRGNSVYFPGHVIPMLPEGLSNGMCSLNPHCDRLVMVCEMELGRTGKLKNYRFYEGVIWSHARLTYTEVAEMLEPDPDNEARARSKVRLQERYAELLPHLQALYEVYQKLAAARRKSGAMDFSGNETRIVFGETRKIREIVPVIRNDAHRLIEECMLMANICAAECLEASELPVLYRVHDGPNMDKMDNLKAFLKERGILLTRSAKPSPKDYQRVLDMTADRPDGHLIQTMMVRSMLQAVYQVENNGHFGLNFDAYTHFTSPIRRYPDLLVHRALRYLIRSGKMSKKVVKARGAAKLAKRSIYPYQEKDMQQFGENCSVSERRADAASYDVLDWLKCEYVMDRVGEEFDGTISSVTGFGLFVQLNDIYVEGLVHITALDNDYYQFDPVKQWLRGEHNGVTFRLGDAVRVRVARVDLDDRKIDLQWVSGRASDPKKKSDKATSGGKSSRGRQSAARKSTKTGAKKAARKTSSRKKSGSRASASVSPTQPPAKKAGKPVKKKVKAKAAKKVAKKPGRRKSNAKRQALD